MNESSQIFFINAIYDDNFVFFYTFDNLCDSNIVTLIAQFCLTFIPKLN